MPSGHCRTVLVVSIIEVIAFIVIIVNDIFVAAVVTDDDNVPVSHEPYEEPGDDPSGTSTPDVSRSHESLPPVPPLRQSAMAQLPPVSIPAVIKDMAGNFVCHNIERFRRSNFDVHGAIETDQVWIVLYQYA
jgi:hypothetical protein